MADLEKIGGYAFLIGVIIAVIAGLVIGSIPAVAAETAASKLITAQQAGVVALILVILGLIVGFLNIKDKQVTNFLVAAIALLGVSLVGGSLVYIDAVVKPVGTVLAAIVVDIALFVAPAALVVALKEVYNIASGK